ncbi:replication initiator protein A [Parvularcula oceani]|uniref:replication initiator protein A n=1 Tax=Parvularcula oceani TaxID=1247963 RepID=UPI0009DCCCB8|nr:replication initiator protein A [Parvularcula oceani]
MQLALPELDSPLHGKVKGERSVMAFPFFALSKGRRMQPITYQDEHVTIEVRPSQTGCATIYDKEILLYIASLLVAQMRRCETPSQEYAFTAHDFLRVIGGNRSARSYSRIQGALERLQGTQIKTNIEAGGEGEDGYFSWVSEAKMSYSKDANGKKRLTAVKVRLCDWLYRALIKDQKILTYDLSYFSLSPIERRLYEIARVHCGQQRFFHVGLEKLQRKVGSEDRTAKFKAALRDVCDRQSIPEYDVQIVEVPDCDGARLIQSEGFKPQITKRTPIVLFTPKGRPARGASRAEVLPPPASLPEARVARESDFLVSPETLTKAGRMFPGHDKYFVLEEWKRWGADKEPPRNADAAFLAFFTTYARNNPLASA